MRGPFAVAEESVESAGAVWSLRRSRRYCALVRCGRESADGADRRESRYASARAESAGSLIGGSAADCAERPADAASDMAITATVRIIYSRDNLKEILWDDWFSLQR